jgi:hypothetical protein
MASVSDRSGNGISIWKQLKQWAKQRGTGLEDMLQRDI